MRIWLFIALALFSALPFSPRPALADDAAVTAQLQQVLDAYVKDRASIEGLSGVALQVDRGAGKPIISVYAGDNGLADKKPIGPDTLFDIGSNTKEFTSALILKLEAAGKLSIDDTIGKWLPQYPAWKDVTIRSLLQMTSPIPNYSETVDIGEIEVADLQHQFSDKDLIGFVDPGNGEHFPPATGWFYSNTNYILAGLIIEAASGMNYEQALTTMILEPLGLHDTFYADGPHPGPAAAGPVMSRVPRALLPASGLPDVPAGALQVSTLAPLIGKDMRMQNLSWAGGGGRHHLEPARSCAMDPRALREARHSRKAARGDDHARLEQDRPASSRSLRRRAGRLRPWPRPLPSKGAWRRLLVLRGRNARLPDDLRLLAAVRSPHHRLGQQPAAEWRGQVRALGDRGAFTALHEAGLPEGASKPAAK